jgi:hypothetical protein
LKWRCIAADGSYVRDLATVQAVGSQQVACDAIAYDSADALVAVTSSGGSTLRYSLTDEQFIFNWQTPSLSGTRCYVFVLILTDGTTHTALFRLKS